MLKSSWVENYRAVYTLKSLIRNGENRSSIRDGMVLNGPEIGEEE